MDIDWSKAPDWAVAHGLHETGFGIKEFWLGETQHQNLEHAKSFSYGGGDPSCGSFHNSRRESFSYVTPRPAPWTGEGLPPVGTVCDLKFDHWTDWERHEILCHGNKFLFVREISSGYDREGSMAMDGIMFRAVRTPEQAAADEREDAITDIALIMGKDPQRPVIREKAAIIYDAGYRKQPSP